MRERTDVNRKECGKGRAGGISAPSGLTFCVRHRTTSQVDYKVVSGHGGWLVCDSSESIMEDDDDNDDTVSPGASNPVIARTCLPPASDDPRNAGRR